MIDQLQQQLCTHSHRSLEENKMFYYCPECHFREYIHMMTTYTEPLTGMEFVFIKGGSCETPLVIRPQATESPNTQLTYIVTVQDFWISRTLLQNVCVNNVLRPFKDHLPAIFGHHSHITKICKLLSTSTHKYTIPTYEQWLYALIAYTCCQTRDLALVLWEDIEDLLAHANICEDDITPHNRYLPNPFGLYDMFGNIAQVCTHDNKDYSIGIPTIIDTTDITKDLLLEYLRKVKLRNGQAVSCHLVMTHST